MIDLKLQSGEGILLQTEDACLYDGHNEISIDELYLTNKNLIYVHEKSTGIFKSETTVDRIPLSSISVVNGLVQTEIVDDDDYGKAIQLIYTTGKRELLEINESPKKLYPIWKNGIINAVNNLDSFVDEEHFEQEYKSPKATNSVKTVFCNQCGKKVEASSKFCNQCGSPIYIDASMNGNTAKQNASSDDGFREKNRDKRNTVYEGTLHKCPNCGELLKSFVSSCPSCGYEIRDARSTGTVQELSKKLESIEARQMPPFQGKRSIMKTLVGKDFNNKDEEEEARQEFEEQKEQQKANLIINFPVPNTREDILELMILSASNINVKDGIDNDVSKAWLQKMDQVYEKAKITIGNTSEFTQIRSIYDRKKGELKNRKFKSFSIASFCVAGFLLFESFCMFMAETTGAAIILLIIAIGVLLLGVKFTSVYIKNNNKL